MIQRREKIFGEISKEEKAIHFLMDHIPKECLEKVSIAV